MNPLSPKEAARFAAHVYVVKNEESMGTARERAMSSHLNDLVDIGGGTRLKGTSGPLLLKKKSGFGYLAEGVGARQGELVLVLRGTVDARDWLTDANIGLQRGPSGWLVHGGFNDTFNSLRDELDDALRGRNPSAIHCIGHSLGGALATLAADHLSEQRVADIRLYTFGSPRVGIPGFSRHLSEKLGEDNINRVFHSADPVSMIPIFPYSHVPYAGTACPIPWNGAMVSPAAHFIDGYVRAIAQGSSWRALRVRPEAVDLDREVRGWLDSANGNVIMLSATGLAMINRALTWLLKKAANIILGTAFTGLVTLLDKLAWILSEGAKASVEFASYLGRLVERIFRFIGRSVAAGVSLTTAFLRWMLDLLFSAVANVAHRAMMLMPF